MVIDGIFYSAQQFDGVIRLIRGRGGNVVALGALAALPLREADIPIHPATALLTLDARIFLPNATPPELLSLPEQDFPVW